MSFVYASTYTKEKKENSLMLSNREDVRHAISTYYIQGYIKKLYFNQKYSENTVLANYCVKRNPLTV